MIKAEVEYNELSDGSHVYDLTIYGPESEVSILCISELSAEDFKEEFNELLERYGV